MMITQHHTTPHHTKHFLSCTARLGESVGGGGDNDTEGGGGGNEAVGVAGGR